MNAAAVELKPHDEHTTRAAGDAACAVAVAHTSVTLDAPSSRAFLEAIPHEFARRHLILGVAPDTARPASLHLITADTTSPAAIFNTAVTLQAIPTTSTAAAEPLAAAIDRAYHQHSQTAAADQITAGHQPPRVTVEGSADLESDLTEAVKEAERDLLHTHGKAPAVRLVDLLLFEALQRGASDVHIQPVRGGTLVRYRLDGVLHTVRTLPLSLAASVISRIKVMAHLDIADQRSPQDGRATVTIGGAAATSTPTTAATPITATTTGRRVDLRISTLPSTYGERVVLRILDASKSPHLLSMSALGMPEAIERQYLAAANRASGIVLSTGPTGSGKTTTLYTTLAWISASSTITHAGGSELNLMTVEDPVEYDLSGPGLAISQTQVDPKKNVTFANGLRHILRQDPDVIMVGEIRDPETAKIAIQASLTGHLVLSTLHTNDASSAVARLIDLGVEPFLVSSSLSAVLAQRLVRRTHADCGGRGCPVCLGSGFRGRTGVFELLVLDSELRELVGTRRPVDEIKAAAEGKGMISLRSAGEALVRAGVTTRAEVARVIETMEDQE